MGRSATLCRSARPHTPRGDRRCTRSWLVSAVELRLGKISASLTQDLVGLTELAVLSLPGLELGGHVRGQARLAIACLGQKYCGGLLFAKRTTTPVRRACQTAL